jgi:hypothetical protein
MTESIHAAVSVLRVQPWTEVTVNADGTRTAVTGANISEVEVGIADPAPSVVVEAK